MAWNERKIENNKVEEVAKKEVVEKTIENSNPKVKPKIVTLYGQKGVGKTYSSLSLLNKNDKILVISFDGKSEQIGRQFFSDYQIDYYDAIDNDKFPRIVFVEKNDETLEVIESIENGFANWQNLLKKLSALETGKYDFILYDGLNLAERLSEAVMRYKKGLKYDENFTDFNNWKIRNNNVNSLLIVAQKKVNKGILYTVYPTEDVRKKKDGQVIDSEQMPKYVEEVMWQTDIVIKISSKNVKVNNSEVKKYYATIESSKFKEIPSGTTYDVTGHNLSDFIRV